jgi:uncharacterized protein YdaU (DUF1376 family)
VKKAKLAWMKYFVGDFERMTGAMSAAERGAHQRLVDHYWTHESIPSNESAICRIARTTSEEWISIRNVVMEMFEHDAKANVWRCPYLDDLKEKQEREYEQQVAAGKRGAEIRAAKRAALSGNVTPFTGRSRVGLDP